MWTDRRMDRQTDKQEGHRKGPKRRIAQAAIRLATAVITLRKEAKKC